MKKTIMWNLFLWMFVSELLKNCRGLPISSGRNGAFIQEVPFGENVVLHCRSNDKNHIFENWILDNNDIIGPTNKYFDNIKFGYEILSGNLTIRAISKRDEGLYTCVSRAVRGEDRKVEKVQVLVAQDWENIYEHDSNINLIRILIILIMVVLLGIGGYVIFNMWRERYKYPNYLEQEDDEESAEELFKSPSTSGINRARSPGRIILGKSDGNPLNDNSNISTDFKSILEKTNE